MKKKFLMGILTLIMSVVISLPVCATATDTDEKSETTNVTQEASDPETKIAELEDKIKELESKIETLEAENADLKAENATLKEKNTVTEPTPTPTEEPKEIVEYNDTTSIRAVQEALNAAGYNCGSPDGIAGSQTTQAITSYQTDKGLTVKGTVTNELLESLGIAEQVENLLKAEGAKNEYSSSYTYEQLARNPDSYMGDKIKFSGKVLQYQEDDGMSFARVAMNSDYNTVIFVTIDNDILGYRLLEDDIVTVYGSSLGIYSYEAVSGATITIPWINADIIEMQ